MALKYFSHKSIITPGTTLIRVIRFAVLSISNICIFSTYLPMIQEMGNLHEFKSCAW